MNGTINIVQEQINSGDRMTIQLQSPENNKFIGQLRIFKDLDEAQIADRSFPLVDMIGQVNLTFHQDQIEPGTPFEVEVVTLNYPPGNYTIMTFATNGGEAIFDQIEILEAQNNAHEVIRQDMSNQNRTFEIYDAAGQRLSGEQEGGAMALLMETAYTLAINLNHFSTLNNQIQVHLFDPAGAQRLTSDLLQIKILRIHQLWDKISLDNQCQGIATDRNDYAQGIALVTFRTPEHHKYYEYDGQFQFVLTGVAVNEPCVDTQFELQLPIDDAPAHPPIPDFESRNAQQYPGQAWRNNYPLDTRNVRIVRYGDLGTTTPAELDALARMVEDAFSTATKDYFKLNVVDVHSLPYINPLNREKVENWYQSVAKTPNKPILNFQHDNERQLATLLYYYEHDTQEMVSDMTQLYPQQSNGEDITVYIFDGPGAGGTAMGQHALRVKSARLYPGYIFYQGEGNNRTYHFDLAACNGFCGNTVEEYLTIRSEERSPETIANVIIHELGHVAWIERAGIATGDRQDQYYPFRSDFVYIDKSIGYYTRSEVMSYGRNRSTIENISYGDAYLERILAAYAQPEVDMEFLSHPDEGNRSITVNAGEEIVFRLIGRAGSGLRMLWYYNQAGPVALPYGTPEKSGVFTYDQEDGRVKNEALEIRITLNAPGNYTYRMRSRDQLYPTVWQPHQSILGTFTIQVQ